MKTKFIFHEVVFDENFKKTAFLRENKLDNFILTIYILSIIYLINIKNRGLSC